MAANTILKRLLDAGMQFTEMSQSTAEKLVNEFVDNGQVRRKDAAKTVQQLVDRGRASTEHLFATVQSEVAKQLGRFADRLDDIEDRIEGLARSLGVTPPPMPDTAPLRREPAAAEKGPAKVAAKPKAPAKKAPAKAAAKKAPAKAAAKKAPAKAAAKKKAVRTPAGSSGVAKVVAKKAAKR